MKYKYLRTILIAMPIIILVYLFNKQYPFNGRLEIVYDFSEPNAFIGNLTPDGRVGEIEKCDDGNDDEPPLAPPDRGGTDDDDDGYCQTMTIDPVYFDLELPASYDTATVELKYQSKNQPVIEIGGLVSKDAWNFQTKPIQNTVINGLLGSWHQIKNKNIVFLQREKQFNSIESFLNNLPSIEKVAIFNYDLNYDYIYPDYVANDDYLEINHSLRGKHSFYTYLGQGEQLDFNFSLLDLNEREGNDDGVVEVYRGVELVKKYSIASDEIVDESRQQNKLNKLKINLDNLEQGVYKVNLIFNDDILIERIKTKQKLLAFIDKLNFYNFITGRLSDVAQPTRDEPINLVSNASLIRAATNYVSGLQTVKINDQDLIVSDVNVGYSVTTELSSDASELSSVMIPKGSIIIQGSGLFSFSKEQFFNPLITVLNSIDKLDNINYVIADYEPLAEIDGWQIGLATLDLLMLYREDNSVKIMISAPDLDKNGGEIKIREIKVILEGRGFWERVLGRLKEQ